MNRHGRYIDLKICKKQYLLLVMTVLCTFVLVIGRLAWIQLYKGRDMQAYAGEQMKLYLQTNTPRGKIVDREGEELAVSVMVGTLTCDPFNMRDENKEDDKTPPRDLKRLSADLLGPIVNVPKEELYQRFTVPLASLVFTLVGVPLGLQPNRHSSSMGFATSIIIIFFYYTLMVIGGAIGNGGVLPPAIAVWLPNFVGLIAGLYLMYKASK